EAEFSRLLSNLDVQVDNLISSVEHLIEECRQHKKIQSEKHSLGKDQANASWTSKMANPNGIAPSRADDMAQEPEEEELGEDEVPAFVSRRPQVGSIGTCTHVPTPSEPWLGAKLNPDEPTEDDFPIEALEPEPVIDPSEPPMDANSPLRGVWHVTKALAEVAAGKEVVEQVITEHRKMVAASNQDL